MHSYRNRLKLHQQNATAPAGGASATSSALDARLVADLFGDFMFFVDAPALATGQLPNGETLTYALVQSNSADLSNPTSTTTMGVQTGAGGAGAAAAILAARPSTGGAYYGLKVTASAGANAAGVALVLALALITDTLAG